jgi:hypothetical protein
LGDASLKMAVAPSLATLGPGSIGPDVEELQRYLAELGFRIRDEVGTFGEDTAFAVRALQSMGGLTADGLVGGATSAALDAAARDWVGTRPQLALIVRNGPTQVGMATLVGNGIAVTTLEVAKVSNLRLASPFWVNEVSVSVARPLLSLAELAMAGTPDDRSVGRTASEQRIGSPRVGSSWKALVCGGQPERFRIASGTIVGVDQQGGAERLLLKATDADAPFRPELAGAPVFVNGRLAAIWEADGRAISYVSPYGLRPDVKLTPLKGEPPPPDQTFAQLGPGALRAVALADELRAAMGDVTVHLTHLLVGLAATTVGVTNDLLARAALDPAGLRALLAAKTGGQIPDPRVIGAPAITALPGLSTAVSKALEEASHVARAQGADRIGVRHLWYGALSVDESRLVQALAERGLTRDAIPLG